MLRPLLLAFTASLSLASLSLTGCTAQTLAPEIASGPVAAPEPTLKPTGGVAAANDPRVGPIGEAIMQQGGSATDAAIAMMLALAVLEPQSSGIGGGGFMVHGSADGIVTTFDGRETAPAAARGDWFLDAQGNRLSRNETVLSGLSIGVPGAIALAAEAHRQYGRLDWAELFAPAIALARNGFALTPRLSGSLASFPDRGGRDPAGLAMFYDANGEAPPAGSILQLPQLAETLQMIADQGPQSFYSGPFAQNLAAKIAQDTPHAEAMTPADLQNYRANISDPLCAPYRTYRVCTMGPPSSGGYAVLAMLGQLERFDLAAMGLRNAQTWHVFLEAQRLAYADRGFYISDPAFVDIPLAGLLDPAYLAGRSAMIDPAAAMDEVAPGRPAGAPLALAPGDGLPEHGTTHFVAVHADGTMVSYTATVEGAFGSGLVHGGFYLNNELTDFSIIPEEDGRAVANRVEGGKRPMSSMSPTLVYDPAGKPLFALGAAGGGLIPVQTARAIIAVIDFGLPLEDALALPFVMSVGADAVLVEQGTWMEALADDFTALGHEQIIPFGQLLRTTGALRTEAGWQALYDPRLTELVRIPPAPDARAAENAGFSEGLTEGSGKVSH